MHRPGGHPQSPSADASQIAPATCRPFAVNPCLGHPLSVESARTRLTMLLPSLVIGPLAGKNLSFEDLCVGHPTKRVTPGSPAYREKMASWSVASGRRRTSLAV